MPRRGWKGRRERPPDPPHLGLELGHWGRLIGHCPEATLGEPQLEPPTFGLVGATTGTRGRQPNDGAGGPALSAISSEGAVAVAYRVAAESDATEGGVQRWDA